MRTSFPFRAARLPGLGLAILLAVSPLSLRADTDPCPNTKVGVPLGWITTPCDPIADTCSIFTPDDNCIPSAIRTKCVAIMTGTPKGWKSECDKDFYGVYHCHAAWTVGTPYGTTQYLGVVGCNAITQP